MGTSIEAFIEIDHSDAAEEFSSWHQVHSFTHDTFLLHRDYDVFDALAGGRNAAMAPEDQDPAREPMVPPRGMPSPRSLSVSQSFFYLVSDPIDPAGPPDSYFWPKHRCVDPDEAEKLIQSDGCVRSEVFQWFNGDRLWPTVSEPGLYNASWLWPREFDESLDHHGLVLARLPVDYRILRTIMGMAEDHHGENRVRLVVWFS